MPRAGSPYGGGSGFDRDRAALLADNPTCQLRLACDGTALATTADHVPPLALHEHLNGSGCCYLIPACLPCQKTQGGRVARHRQVQRSPRPSRRW